TNCTTTCEMPSLVVERSSSMPETVLTISSMGLVTCVSISSTLAPRRVVVIDTTGRSTFGNKSTPKRKYDAAPSTIGAEISMIVKTGRLIQISQRFIGRGGLLPPFLFAFLDRPSRGSQCFRDSILDLSVKI